jgi:hypothetical protein
MRWAGAVAYMGALKNVYKTLFANLTGEESTSVKGNLIYFKQTCTGFTSSRKGPVASPSEHSKHIHIPYKK